jgi:hypothetical protein
MVFWRDFDNPYTAQQHPVEACADPQSTTGVHPNDDDERRYRALRKAGFKRRFTPSIP